MVQASCSRKSYPADLTDEPWAIVEPLIPPAQQNPRGGRPREVDMRAILTTIFSLTRRGCQWDMLPHDWLPKSTVYDDCAQGRDDGTWTKMGKAGRARTRVEAGREPPPSAACIESQSVKTTEMGGPERGDDGGKNITGRKRHLWVDTWGVLSAVLMTSAALDDGAAAPSLLGHVTPHDVPRLITICADTQDHQHAFAAWMAAQRAGWHLAVTTRPEGTRGFTPLEKRWVVERTNAGNGRSRRNSKDDESRTESSTAMIQISNINLMFNRLAPCRHHEFHYRKNAA